MVYEEDAVQMIDLMLDTPGQIAFGVQYDRFPLAVQCPYLNLIGSLHHAVIARIRQAALRPQLLPAHLEDFRVDQLNKPLSAIHDNEPAEKPDLRGG
ncbi:hypothetical protein D3C73_1491630 [compost metagenome]